MSRPLTDAAALPTESRLADTAAAAELCLLAAPMKTLKGVAVTAAAHSSAHHRGRRHLKVAQCATVAILTVTAVGSSI